MRLRHLQGWTRVHRHNSTRTLNPELQTFEKWLTRHKDQIPLN